MPLLECTPASASVHCSYGVGRRWWGESLGLHGLGKFALESTLEFGSSLLEVNEIGSSLRKRNRKVLYLKIHLFRKYFYSLHLNLGTIDILGENSLLWGLSCAL